MTDPRKKHSRYPFTYSADYIRILATEKHPEHGFPMPTLSRGQAAAIVSRIAEIIGMDERELKSKIADRYLQENPQ